MLPLHTLNPSLLISYTHALPPFSAFLSVIQSRFWLPSGCLPSSLQPAEHLDHGPHLPTQSTGNTDHLLVPKSNLCLEPLLVSSIVSSLVIDTTLSLSSNNVTNKPLSIPFISKTTLCISCTEPKSISICCRLGWLSFLSSVTVLPRVISSPSLNADKVSFPEELVAMGFFNAMFLPSLPYTYTSFKIIGLSSHFSIRAFLPTLTYLAFGYPISNIFVEVFFVLDSLSCLSVS